MPPASMQKLNYDVDISNVPELGIGEYKIGVRFLFTKDGIATDQYIQDGGKETSLIFNTDSESFIVYADEVLFSDNSKMERYDQKGFNNSDIYSTYWNSKKNDTKNISGEWVPPIKGKGIYDVKVHIPDINYYKTTKANYILYSNQEISLIDTWKKIPNNQWFSLGKYLLKEGDKVYLNVNSIEYNRYVSYDAMMFVKVANSDDFSDMPRGDDLWYRNHVNKLKLAGIIKGKNKDGVNVFAATDKVTKAEFLKMSMLAANYSKHAYPEIEEDTSSEYTMLDYVLDIAPLPLYGVYFSGDEVYSKENWFYPYMVIAYLNNIFGEQKEFEFRNGVYYRVSVDNSVSFVEFYANRNISRLEAAKMLTRSFQKRNYQYNDKSVITAKDKRQCTFDNGTYIESIYGDVAYKEENYSVFFLCENNIMSGKDNKFRHEDFLTRAEAAKIIDLMMQWSTLQ